MKRSTRYPYSRIAPWSRTTLWSRTTPWTWATLWLPIALLLSSNGHAQDAEAQLLTEVRQLTFEGRRAGEGYFSADGRRMVFQSERDEGNPFYQIYLMDLGTGDVARVSPGHGKTTCGWIHPRENRVLYASTHDDPAARDEMRAELEFRASGQERRYAWDYDEQYEIYTQDLNGGEPVNLTRTAGYDAEGSYSPDGTRIAFASNRRAWEGAMSAEEKAAFERDPSYAMDLYIMDADGRRPTRLTDAPGYDGGPFFSPDGGSLTWRRFSADGSRAEIYTMDLASLEERQVTRMDNMSWASYFHPSGDYLIFTSNREGFANFELFVVDAPGERDPVRVTHTDGFDGLPVFSPDGETLSWTSNRTAGKQSQIYRARWNDAEARQLLGLPAPGDGPDESTAAATADAEITSADARAHVERLTADDMDGRLTGTPGEILATRYVADVFARIGLEPGGDDGDWFQTFPFTAGARLGNDNRLIIAGAVPNLSLAPDEDWRPLGLSRNGAADEAEVVFAGYGIVAPASNGQPAYDAYGDLDVTGKWVLVFRYLPEDVTPNRRRHLLRYSGLSYKASWARRKGAAGLLVVTGPTAAANHPLVPLALDGAASGSSLTALSISDAIAAALLGAAGEQLEPLQKRHDAGEPVVGFAIPGMRVAAHVDVVREQREGRNVIAILPARSDSALPPVIMGAHVDHLGRGQASGSLARDDEKGRIHRGADDNASGVAGLLESAQWLAGLAANKELDARRDLWFVAWSGEELGTLGSTYFVEQIAGSGDLKDKVAAYLNLDMIGRLSDEAHLQGTGSSSIWAREIERRNAPVGLAVTTSADPYLPTDSTPFYLEGVPTLGAFTGVHEEYSTPRDTPDLIDYDGLRDVARLMAGIARSLAQSADEPDYVQVERTGSGAGRAAARAYLGTIPSYAEAEGIVGVKLQGAVKGSPAERAGVLPDDVLVALAGVELENIYDLMTVLSGLKPGEPTGMTVLREGKRFDLKVVPAARD